MAKGPFVSASAITGSRQFALSGLTGYYYGDGEMDVNCLVQNLVGAISKENKEDLEKVKGYFNTVVLPPK